MIKIFQLFILIKARRSWVLGCFIQVLNMDMFKLLMDLGEEMAKPATKQFSFKFLTSTPTPSFETR